MPKAPMFPSQTATQGENVRGRPVTSEKTSVRIVLEHRHDARFSSKYFYRRDGLDSAISCAVTVTVEYEEAATADGVSRAP